MVESDITGNISSDCENPLANSASEMHHPDCTCDGCCQSSQSICEDNDCSEAQQVTGGKKKMRNKLVPILANCAVLLAFIGISVRIIEAAEIHPSLENRAAAITTLASIQSREIINAPIAGSRIEAIDNAIVNADRINLIPGRIASGLIIASADIETITPTTIAIEQKIDG
jgi:hypothetical protein